MLLLKIIDSAFKWVGIWFISVILAGQLLEGLDLVAFALLSAYPAAGGFVLESIIRLILRVRRRHNADT